MEQLQEHLKKDGTLHHAYIIEGSKEGILKQLVAFFEHDLGISLVNNPDCWMREFLTFGIDEARDLRERQSRMSASGGRKIFVISAERLTVEAQNALLKTLEEPTAGTLLFIIVPNTAQMLPTIRSRAVFLHVGDSSSEKDAEMFLKAPYYEREKFLKPLADEGDRAHTETLLYGLQDSSKERLKKTGDTRAYRSSLLAIEKCRAHLGGRAPSIKMLLEYLAITLPREKTIDFFDTQ